MLSRGHTQKEMALFSSIKEAKREDEDESEIDILVVNIDFYEFLYIRRLELQFKKYYNYADTRSEKLRYNLMCREEQT